MKLKTPAFTFAFSLAVSFLMTLGVSFMLAL
jgi:hypothetical protein